jgi:hypothetical protein
VQVVEHPSTYGVGSNGTAKGRQRQQEHRSRPLSEAPGRVAPPLLPRRVAGLPIIHVASPDSNEIRVKCRWAPAPVRESNASSSTSFSRARIQMTSVRN